VKKMSRRLLISLGVIVGVALLILIGVNMYVQSRGTQARIQQELSQRLGTTLRIQRISITPWAGLKLTGITIPQSQPGVSPDFRRQKRSGCGFDFHPSSAGTSLSRKFR
jgi:hypothetical protein